LQAQGPSQQLIEFVSCIKDLNSKAIFINSLSISGDESNALLNLELAIYVAPFGNSSASRSATVQSSTGSKSAALPAPPTAARTDTPFPSPAATATFTPMPSAALSTATVPLQRYAIHVVAQGETINTLARQYGITVEAIRAANRMTRDDLRPNQQVLVPIR
jgi:LysM repeat protein